MLKITNLVKKYGTKRAVDDISFEVNSGDITAFIGHNGAGKTTTLKAIVGLIGIDGGDITVDGHSIKTEPIEVKKVVGYLPDNPDLYESLKGIDYLNFIADIFKVDSATRKARIEEYSKRLELVEALKAPISSYSHGMKQKIAIISVLVHKPKLYVFDEPFVGLDPKVSHEFKKIMQEEVASGAAVLFSTHVLEVAEKLCSNVVIIKNGKLVGSGKMQDVKGDKGLENIFLELENE